MRCKDANKLMDSYLNGKLDSEVQQELEKHLLVCTNCQDNLLLIKSLRNLATEDTSNYTDNPYFATKVLSRIENRKVTIQVDFRNRIISYAAIAAAIMVGVFLGYRLGNFGTEVIMSNSNAELLAEEYIPSSTETIYSINFEDVENQKSK